jgi:hypothetical protein
MSYFVLAPAKLQSEISSIGGQVRAVEITKTSTDSAEVCRSVTNMQFACHQRLSVR